MKLPKIKPIEINRNQKFLLKAAAYFAAIYIITVQMLIFALDYFVG
jgi:hypothetical protein